MGSESEQLLKYEDVNEETNESVKVSGTNKNSSESHDVDFNLSESASHSAKPMGIADIKAAAVTGLGWLQQSNGVMGLVINYGMNVVWNVAASWIQSEIDEYGEKLEKWLMKQLNDGLIAQGKEPILLANKSTTLPANSNMDGTKETKDANAKSSTDKDIYARNLSRIQSLVKEIAATGSLAKRLEAAIQFIDLITTLKSAFKLSIYSVLIPEKYKEKPAEYEKWLEEFKVYLKTALSFVRAFEKIQLATSWEKMLALGGHNANKDITELEKRLLLAKGLDEAVANLHVLKASMHEFKGSFVGEWIKTKTTGTMQYVKESIGESNFLGSNIPEQWDWDDIIYLTEYGRDLIKYWLC